MRVYERQYSAICAILWFFYLGCFSSMSYVFFVCLGEMI